MDSEKTVIVCLFTVFAVVACILGYNWRMNTKTYVEHGYTQAYLPGGVMWVKGCKEEGK